MGALAQSPDPATHDRVLDNNPDRIGIWKCWVLRGWEKTGVPGEKNNVTLHLSRSNLLVPLCETRLSIVSQGTLEPSLANSSNNIQRSLLTLLLSHHLGSY